MTRFARAKGSKASNERLPEQATSWSEMKQQLLEKNKEIEDDKKRKEIIDQRNASYKAFLEEKEEDENKNSKWADFPEVSKPPQRKKKSELPSKNLGKKISSKNLVRVKEQDSSDDEEFTSLRNKIDNILDKNVNKVDAIVEANAESDSDAPPEEDSTKKEIIEPVIKAKKRKKVLLKIVVNREESAKESKSDQEEKSRINKKKRKTPEAAENTKSKKRKLSKDVLENGKEIIKNNKTKQRKLKNGTDEIKQKEEIINENLTEKDLKKIEKKKLRRLKQVEKKKRIKAESYNRESEMKNEQEQSETEGNIGKAEGTNKMKQKNKKIIKENLTEKDLKKIEKKNQKRLKQLEKKKKAKAELNNQKESEMKIDQEQSEIGGNLDETESKSQINLYNTDINNSVSKKQFNKSNNFNKNEKKAKIKGEEKPQRRKPLLPHKMFIHDKEVKIDYVEGFPIKKEDAERLKKLRREMISKGLPRSEINAALKLERRRAERALANLKKKACFHCRKSGHNLSECPELNKNQLAETAASGICFKCGSTEHTHFQCKVVHGQEYKFAQCFICKEQGHISRQCPDNARGLYPKGGACHVCGDVTHLKRDCPKYQAQQQRQEDNFRVETFGNSNPDVLEENSGSISGVLSNKKQNKIIKF